MISSWVTLRQPWRSAVPTQSVPVSPPPMTTTSLPRAWIGLAVRPAVEQRPGVGGEELHREVHALELAAFDGEVARLGGAGAEHDGVEVAQQQVGLDVVADVGVADELDARCSISLMRRSDHLRLSSFMFGMPYMSRPPRRSSRSNTVTGWPALLSCSAAARPAGPEPMTATFLPVRISGGSGSTQPSSQPRSMIAPSMFLIVTGGSLMPSTQEPSHGAGQTRPVNSGKLLVLCRRSSASRHRPR